MPGGEPVVLFQRGAVRLLDSLLSAPQQPIEEVLAQEESIRSASPSFTTQTLTFQIQGHAVLQSDLLSLVALVVDGASVCLQVEH